MKILAISAIVSTLFLTACVSNPSTQPAKPSGPGADLLIISKADKPKEFSTYDGFIPPQSERCDAVPEPLQSISLAPNYKDAAGSIIDTENFAKNDKLLKPINEWNDKLDGITFDYLHYKDKKKIACGLAWLDYWANKDAFLWNINKNTDSGVTNYQRWGLAKATSAYLELRQFARPDQNVRITWWINQMVISSKKFWDEHPNHPHNNQLTYTAVGVMQAGIIMNDPKNIEWGRQAFNDQMSRISANGSMPQEIERGAMARHYHNFNLAGLYYMAQLSKLIGEDWTKNENLQRLIDFTIEANINPATIEKLSGAKQTGWAISWGWIGNFPKDDPRRVKMLAGVSEHPKEKDFRYGTPFLGNQEVFRDFIEKNKK